MTEDFRPGDTPGIQGLVKDYRLPLLFLETMVGRHPRMPQESPIRMVTVL